MIFFQLGRDWIELMQALSLSMARILAVFSILPFMGRETLPGMIRTGLVISIAVVIVPTVLSQWPTQALASLDFLILIFKEGVVGFALGYLVAIIFWAASGVGALIDTQRGAAIAGVLNPQIGDQATPLGTFLNQMVVTFFFVSGGFLILLEAIYQSYVAWPVFDFFPSFPLAGAKFFLEQFDLLFYLVVFLSGPIVVAMFIAELGLGLVSRFVPQLNVFVLAMPLKSGVGLFVMVVYITVLLKFFRDEFRSIIGFVDTLDVILR